MLLAIYFFAYFAIVFTLVNASNSVGVEININYQDAGFNDFADPFDNEGFCTGIPDSTSCSGLLNVFSNESCNRLEGCTWIVDTCYGTPAVNGFPVSFCTPSMNYSTCHTLGCVWNVYTGQSSSTITPTSPVDISPITKTIAVMSGYNAEVESDYLGIPSVVRLFFAFIFFWVPLTMLIIAVYFALPFAH